MMENKIQKPLLRSAVNIAALVVLLLAVNFVASRLFFRVDLTSENRYTLAPVTRTFLKQLDHEILVKVYLDGELNVGFSRLRKATREMLDEFDVYAGKGITFQFVDPLTMTKEQGRQLTESLESVGLGGVPVFETTEDGRKTRSVVFPYALVQLGDEEIWINLLDNLPGLSGEENLNNSSEGLEYKLVDGIRKLTVDEKPRIAFLEGHGELDEVDVVDITGALSEYFTVERGQVGNDPALLDPYKAVIVAKPATKFNEQEKFALDQYFMKGGRVLWLVDAVTMTLDSLRSSSNTLGLLADFNIDDMLFRYGVRINPEVIEDIQAGMVPINVSKPGEGPKFVPMPWLFSPLLTTNPAHPISRHVNAVKGDFTSYLDTVGENLNINRTVLLRSSRFTKVNKTPVFATLATIHQQPERELFNRSFLPVALLQEGVFESVFINRSVPTGVRYNEKIKTNSEPTRMIVVADGDVIRNDVRFRNSTNPKIIPLGFDEVTNQNFGNKQFIINAVHYLTDDEGWMTLRNRSFALRLLDKEKLGSGTSLYKVVAVGLPLVLLLLAGVVFVWWRRRRYAKN
ncbi:MAG: gliding motility-associated ABC transporter substrate-binding protein GldG [Breznakibacter sp.]